MSTTQDILFELGTEELPPVALKKLSNALTTVFCEGLDSAKLKYGEVTSYAAPRRLAILIKNCEVLQPNKSIERRGPAVKAAFDADGNPTKAATGFAAGCKTTVDKLSTLKTDKGEWLTYEIKEEGKKTIDLLPAIAENALAKLPIPKRMRWGSSDVQFVRPVQWLLFLLGDDVVPCTILEAVAGNQSYGHRFHHPDAVTISKPNNYADALMSAHVIASFEMRKEKIRKQVTDIAKTANGIAEIDEDLLDEVTALNEWPAPIMGDFEEEYLEVPHEALILTMKKNQKYFPVFDAKNNLLNKFITIANLDSTNPDVIKEGNERVIRPRLSDAMFFWKQDAKKTLENHLETLKTVVFQKQLGSVFDKSVRVSQLAEYLSSYTGSDTKKTKRAALLSRSDLSTEMVTEFADMQGTMGRYQAIRDNEDPEVAIALSEFYMPRYSGDKLPGSDIGYTISLADKIDTLVAIFGIGMKPTGDKDPFALRRAALGTLRILSKHSLTVNLFDLLAEAKDNLSTVLTEDNVVADVHRFLIERLKGIYLEQGNNPQVFDAVASVKPTSIVDFDSRIKAVSTFQKMSESETLAAANKRAGNLLKKVDGDVSDAINKDLFETDQEKDLYSKITSVQESIKPLLEDRNYSESLKEMATLKPQVDAFLDGVMIMADDESIRNNRLSLLKSLNQLFLQVADISKLS